MAGEMAFTDDAGARMTSRERVLAALEGKPVDRTPVTVPYATLYQEDHFGELTGRPGWQWGRWLNSPPDEYCRVFQEIHAKAPFEMVQPHGAPSAEERENVEFVERGGQGWRHDRRDDSWSPMATVSGHARDYRASEEQRVFSKKDADELMRPHHARERIASGAIDYVKAVSGRMRHERFILSGGVIGTMFSVQPYVGETAMLAMMVEDPELFDYAGGKAMESSIEQIRALASGGGDAIFIDETLASSDAISPAHYEKFCLPRTRELVNEIHRMDHKAMVFFFGGVSDRLDLIAATGADAVVVEASMKGYVNDVVAIAKRIGDRMCVLGNVDPLSTLEKGSDEELEAEMKRQAGARRHARGYIASTGSPITPRTPLSRVRRFLDLGAKY